MLTGATCEHGTYLDVVKDLVTHMSINIAHLVAGTESSEKEPDSEDSKSASQKRTPAEIKKDARKMVYAHNAFKYRQQEAEKGRYKKPETKYTEWSSKPAGNRMNYTHRVIAGTGCCIGKDGKALPRQSAWLPYGLCHWYHKETLHDCEMADGQCLFEHEIPASVTEIVTNDTLTIRRIRDKKQPKALYKLFPDIYVDPKTKEPKKGSNEQAKKRKAEEEESHDKKKRRKNTK